MLAARSSSGGLCTAAQQRQRQRQPPCQASRRPLRRTAAAAAAGAGSDAAGVAAAPPTKEQLLAAAARVSRVCVRLPAGEHVLAPQHGKMLSVAIYAHLARSHSGLLTPSAAAEGLVLYGEQFVAEARQHRGSHPNIDILFDAQQPGAVPPAIEVVEE